jgi:hypothetical protein
MNRRQAPDLVERCAGCLPAGQQFRPGIMPNTVYQPDLPECKLKEVYNLLL